MVDTRQAHVVIALKVVDHLGVMATADGKIQNAFQKVLLKNVMILFVSL